MKVRKEASKNGGYNITVEVGGRVWNSYWSAPGKSVDHAGIEYLSDRYPIITTKKRAEEFKRQYKQLWMEVIEYQVNKNSFNKENLKTFKYKDLDNKILQMHVVDTGDDLLISGTDIDTCKTYILFSNVK
ncbi:TPA: hypothetical protein LA742_004177 [Clostridium botulinum]|uniref:hypothetical protein n=1 Tax=Clostridium TaxID=1485 RepID=UPI00077352DE|nr:MULTISPECIES: hypothetical protein [Clostridium]AUM96114.1 hypothetical protein RSJ11_13490 [Clostridium sporogenes]AVQ53562.1 hypothetical protein C7M59_12100 [Clostridium botulinum]HBJ2613224.1 hypothetical protein [Clostridium botulinum]HBJ2615645.1 hypothetical protein [Clostridium botulinum]